MKVTNTALLLVAATTTFQGSGAFVVQQPNSRVPAAARNHDPTTVPSSTELNMGLRSFFSRNKKQTKSTAEPDISKEEVRALFSLWNNALATGDSRLVSSRYAEEAVLLPTVSDTPRTDKAAITDYFDNFLLKQPQGEILDGDIRIGNGWAQDAG